MRYLATALIIMLAGVAQTTARAATAPAPESAPHPQPSYDARLSGYDYPHPVQTFKLMSQRQPLEMAFMDVKPQGAARGTALLLHGKNFNGAYWGSTIDALVKEGLRVVVPDQIGFGKSSKPEHYQYSFHQLAHNTRALLTHLGVEQVAVIGHSMGGMLAVRFALLYPDATHRLVLVNPIGLEDYGAVVSYRTVEQWYESELQATPASIRQYQLENYYDGRWRPAYEEWLKPLTGWTRGADRARVAWNAALTYDMIMTQPVVRDLPGIAVPTLLLIGTRDRTAVGKGLVEKQQRARMGRFDQLGKQTQRAIEGAKLVEFEGVGHLPHIEAFPQFIAPLRAFVAPTPAPSQGRSD